MPYRGRILTHRERHLVVLARQLVATTADEHEVIADIVAGAWDLGKYRAHILGRPFEVGYDLPFALSIFCWWPFMPKIAEDNLRILRIERSRLFQRISTDMRVRDRLLRAIPPAVLDQSFEELFDLLQTTPVDRVINFDVR